MRLNARNAARSCGRKINKISANKNSLERYSFPDYDPDQQLIAISEVINQLMLCLDEKEKDFENTDYSKINSGYAGDLYASDVCELGFLDVAVSRCSYCCLRSIFRRSF